MQRASLCEALRPVWTIIGLHVSTPSTDTGNRMGGAFLLFRALGVSVYLHWSWLIVAIIEIQYRRTVYDHILWNVLEYVSLFGIVLMHEYGHALACRSVGGKAERIMLWPLGGVAYVEPPQRPGAVLWSIAAGPLVNLALIPISFVALAAAHHLAGGVSADFEHYLEMMLYLNGALLVFNLLPIFPLDGGQMLRAVLWFAIGPIRSLSIAASIGLVGAFAGIGLALSMGSIWLVIIAFFAVSMCLGGLTAARAMAMTAKAPRYPNVVCRECAEAAPAAPAWRCACGNTFDVFAHRGQCPKCGRPQPDVRCPFCGKEAAIADWFVPVATALDGPAVAADTPLS